MPCPAPATDAALPPLQFTNKLVGVAEVIDRGDYGSGGSNGAFGGDEGSLGSGEGLATNGVGASNGQQGREWD